MSETTTTYRVTVEGLQSIKRFLLEYHRDFHPTGRCPECRSHEGTGGWEQWRCAQCGHAWGIDDFGESYGMEPIPKSVLYAWAERAECGGASCDDDGDQCLSIEIGALHARKRQPVTLSLWRCLGEIEPD